MATQDPVSVVEAFNDCINNQDIEGLSELMSNDHTFIDRDGQSHGPKSYMVKGWKEFFKMFPKYRNTFSKIVSEENLVYVLGFAFWTDEESYDPVIWTGVVENDLISEWRVYGDTPENRKKFNLI